MIHFQRKPEVTADGSLTFYIPEIDEHYHSTNGAVVEAQHVYLKEALLHYIAHSNADSVRILEVGFGTGLNAFLTLLKADELKIPVYFTTLELYPLTIGQIDLLNYPDQIAPERKDSYRALHLAEWECQVPVTPYFTLEKRHCNLVTDQLEGVFDVVYFDAFAPDKQPEIWSEEIYRKIAGAMHESGVFTTYCAKGVVRRGFRDAGFQMERIPGPPGKREMIRGTLTSAK